MNGRRFHITPQSVLAASLLVGGIQALISGLREPLVSGAIVTVNWLIDRIKPDSVRLSGTAMSWPFFCAGMASGLILVMLAIGFGASALRRRSAA